MGKAPAPGQVGKLPEHALRTLARMQIAVRLLCARQSGGGGEKMNQRKDDYMRGYGDGFKDGLAEAKRSDRRRPEPNQPDMTHEADIRVISDVQT
jgi:hypothetical protein